MKDYKISKRYAKALLRLCIAEKKISTARSDLKNFIEVTNQQRGLFLWIADEEVTRQKRRALVSDLAGALNMDQLVVKFLDVLIEKDRMRYIKSIEHSFNELADEVEGIVKTRVVVADKGSGKDVADEIGKIFSSLLKKQINVIIEEDSSMIGGARIYSHNRVWDLSISRTLSDMKESLCQ